jgi:hypothetical protein
MADSLLSCSSYHIFDLKQEAAFLHRHSSLLMLDIHWTGEFYDNVQGVVMNGIYHFYTFSSVILNCQMVYFTSR